jgi:predicted ester cyclase
MRQICRSALRADDHFGQSERVRRSDRSEGAHMEPENKALVTRFYEQVWNEGHTVVAHELFHDEYVRHDLRPTSASPGGVGQAKIASDFRAAFPDVAFRVDLIVAEGDMVAARWTASGTHTGVWGDVEPTHRYVTFSGVNFFRIAHGKIVEIWNHRDDLGLLQQTGAEIYAGAAPPPDDH